MISIISFGACVAFAIAPLAICIRLRDIVKKHRQGIVDELAKFFDTPSGSSEDIVQSFEFVKFKYNSPKDFDAMNWFVPSIFLIAFLFSLNIFSTMIVLPALEYNIRQII